VARGFFRRAGVDARRPERIACPTRRSHPGAGKRMVKHLDFNLAVSTVGSALRATQLIDP